jgi:hypothetical protein
LGRQNFESATSCPQNYLHILGTLDRRIADLGSVKNLSLLFRQCPFNPDLSGLYEDQSLVNVLFPQEIHVQISFRTPLGTGHMTETGSAEH